MASFDMSRMKDFFGGGGFEPLAGGLFGMMRGYNNPADSANNYLDRIPGTMQPYYQPYMDAGKNSLGTLQDQFKKLLQNPSGIMNQIGAGYQQSPGYRFKVDEATNAANRAAAARGMLGSPMEQQELAKTITGYANQDYNDYMDRGSNLYGMGLRGEEGLNQMGFSASNQMVENLLRSLLSQAQLSYAGQQNENEKEGGDWGSLLSGVGSLAKLFL